MNPIDKATAQLQEAAVPYTENEPLAPYTTFRIGGPASIFVAPATIEHLQKALAIAGQSGVPYTLLGKGSNVLFLDSGFAGMVIHLADNLAAIEVNNSTVTAAAGADLMQVCRAARDAGLAGLEFAYGIPGSVGGAVYMNAGAYGGEIKDVLHSVTYLDEGGMLHTKNAAELKLGYRSSVFQLKSWCVVNAVFKLKADNREEINARMQDYMQRRRDKQPLDLPSAGSAFKRPPGAFAGALIDECGLRGYKVGGAAISEKHCGFIVNLGGASCSDVLALADEVCKQVKEKTGYNLEKEIRVIATP